MPSLPLRQDTAHTLKSFFGNKTPEAKAFGVPTRTADMLKADLEGAGINYVDDSGHVADFHSLRHTAGSLFAASGVHPKIAQTIMRHSDIGTFLAVLQSLKPKTNHSLPVY